jgi:peptidoglycan/xylan/chitin deacetylase (PgdA/CDA1 family)
MKRALQSIFTAALVLFMIGAVGPPGASAAPTPPNLMQNPGLETAGSGSPSVPLNWTFSSWGTNIRASSTYYTTASNAHAGTHSVRVDITARPTDGDAKWVPDPVPVTGGAYYTFSDWYKSSVNSAVSVEYWTAGQDTSADGTWANLFSGIAPASNWTQYQTGFTMPPGAVAARFVHFIAGVGWLQTDDYSLTQETTPPGFSAPMVSLTFDDGSAGFYANALPSLNSKGFKTTQYIPTGCEIGAAPAACGLGKDPFMMTPAQVQTIASQGHEIGSHSVTHPDLTTVTDAQLAAEMTQSKATLEAITGAGTVTDFAYPFGTYDARVIAAEQKAGYTSGRSVEEGYNSKLDVQPYDIRVQNMLPTTTLAQFQGWVDYAKAHNYWLVIVYHEVQPDATPVCKNPNADPKLPPDPDPCVGPYDTTVSQFQQQLDYISTAGVGADVKTVREAMNSADTQIHAPSVASVAIAPTNPTTGSTLTATPGAISYSGSGNLTKIYAWTVNGQAVTGATDATGTKFTVPPVKRGDTITVTLSVSDGTYTSDPVTATVTVANSAPTGSVTISPAAPSVGTALTATASFSDADGDALTYKYAWTVNDQRVTDPTVTGNYLPGSMVVAGTVSVQVTADDGHGGTASATGGPITVGDYPHAGTVTIVPADPTTDQTMMATPSGFTDPQGDGLTLSYQWLVNGALVPGATGETLDLSQAGHGDRGDKVQVKVTATNAYGPTSVVSDPVTVADTAPTGGSVAITPADPVEGAALTATPSGFTDADADALSYHFSWFQNGQLIAQNTTGLLPGSSVLAGTVSVQVTADDGHGGTSQVASAWVPVAAPPAPVVQPSAPVVQPPAPAVDGTPPEITITSPNRAIFRRWQTVVVKFGCRDASGVANCTATLGPVGATASKVTSGKKVLLSKNGRYVLSISARDRVGNFGSRTVFFRVTEDKRPPAIAIASPKGLTYRLWQSMLVKFSCSDPSGVAACSATLGPVSGRASKVTSGSKVRLSKRGRYVLRINARDGVGNSATKTLYLSVR